MLLLPLLLACHPDPKPDDTDHSGVDDTSPETGDSTDTAETGDTSGDPPVTFTEGPCLKEVRGARCGMIVVPETRGAGDGRTVSLPVMVLPAQDEAKAGAPLMLFNGGPGSSAAGLVSLVVRGGVMAPLREQHDIVLLGERGTPGAIPDLDCPELAAADEVFTADAATRSEARLDAYGACRERLVADGVDLGAFDEDARAADVPDAMRALGYTEWHAWGVSGGAILVQRLLRDHPEGLLSAHADSGGFPVPSILGVVTDLLPNVGDRYQRLFDTCAADPGCAAAWPGLEDDLWTLVARLEAEPVPRTITHPLTGEEGVVELDGDTLLLVLTNNFGYVAYLPSVVSEGLAGRYDLLDSVLPWAFVSDSGTSFSDGLYLSMFCADVGDLARDDLDLTGVPAPLVAALGPSVDEVLESCAIWDVPALEPGGSVTSDVPTLFMEGMFDTNRRPEGGRSAAEGYTHATVAEFEGRAHVVIDACAVDLMGQVLAAPEAEVDLSCVPQEVAWVLPESRATAR